MANQELQMLYKMRDALKREEYVKSYNENINQSHITATHNAVAAYRREKDAKYNKYQALKEEHTHDRDKGILTGNLLSMLIPFSVVFVLILLLSSNVARSLMHLFCTWVWASAMYWYGTTYAFDNKYRRAIANTFMILFFAMLLGAIISASMNGVSGFWRWFGAFWLLAVWPIANFFFIGPVRWLSIISFFAAMVSGLSTITSLGFAKNRKTDAINSENHPDVRKAKAAYDLACREYDAAYNAQYLKFNEGFKKMMKADNYSQDKRALTSVIPLNLQNIDMVNKLIWCIEQRYADTVVQARNWYLQQEHNAIMMQTLNGVASKLNDIERVQREAAAEAARAHQAILAAMADQTVAINKQTGVINKQMDKLNKTARENAEANKSTSSYAEKIHREVKY